MNHNISISDSKISLEPMDAEAAQKYRMIRNQKQNSRYFGNSKYITKKSQSKWYTDYLADCQVYMFAIRNKKSVFIGGCGVYNIDRENKIGEFGRFLIADNERGKGYGEQTLRLICDVARNVLKINVLYLHVKKENKGARHLYEKVGFGNSLEPLDSCPQRREGYDCMVLKL